jgi:VWFA-related protein
MLPVLAMNPTRVSIIVVACTAAAVAARQAPSEPPRFRVAVDVVSIDAVVTDRKGEVVRDLTAADFEVFQDGKRQKVTVAQFVPVITVAAPAPRAIGSSAVPAPAAAEAPGVPAPPITREQVRRTIVLVVDDLGLSVEGMNNIRRALRGFVDTALLPTDLVAIVRTGDSRGMLQSLTNDRGALQAAIDALRYHTLSRKGVSPFGDVVQVGSGDGRSDLSAGAPEFDEVSGPERAFSTAGSLAALNLVVQAAGDLPGRKTVIFASEGFELAVGTDPTAGTSESLDARRAAIPDFVPLVRDGVDRVVDQATRSGVVIYAIDGQALQPAGLRASDDIHSIEPLTRDAMAGAVRGLAADRQRARRDAQESLAYLAEQTGGFAVMNTNDLAGGLSRISNDVRDYYVIGYEPDQNTFALNGKPPRLHKIAVNVRRAGVRVRTRKQFIGVSDPERPSGPPTPAQQLVRAAISPFSAVTIALHATNLPGYAPGRGMFVRTVLHVDAQTLAFSTDANGKRTASADLVGLVFNSAGAQVDIISTGFEVTLESAAAERALKEGLVYTARVPIGKPGGYQLRYAVRDRRSGAIGSVGGFVHVPDVMHGAFALSGLILRAGDRTAANESIDSDRFSVPPADALRVYAPGTQLSYSYEIYNYNAGIAVQVVTSLWRGTDRVTSLPPDTLVPPADGGPFAAAGALTLADDLPAGTYVLQIAATSDDPKHAKGARGAVQRLSFDVK